MNDKKVILLKFAKHLTKIRKDKGLSIRQLAASSGLEYSQLQRIEKGKVNFAFSTLYTLSEGLDMELSKLLENFEL